MGPRIRVGWTGLEDGRRRSIPALGLALGLVPLGLPLPAEWRVERGSLVTVCQFEDFVATVEFVNRLVEPAERLEHHPDLEIAYNRLTIRLTTHDAGGVTRLDAALATEISALHAGACESPQRPPRFPN